jgi:hypothetical protein
VTTFLANNGHYIMGILAMALFGALLALGIVTSEVAVPILTAAAGLTIGQGIAVSAVSSAAKSKSP